MLIVCPSCASRYSIDDDKIGVAGRTVRCANCRNDFFVSRATSSGRVDEPVATRAASSETVCDANAAATAATEPAPVLTPDEQIAAEWETAEAMDAATSEMNRHLPRPTMVDDIAAAEIDAMFEEEMASAQREAQAILDSAVPEPQTKQKGFFRAFLQKFARGFWPALSRRFRQKSQTATKNRPNAISVDVSAPIVSAKSVRPPPQRRSQAGQGLLAKQIANLTSAAKGPAGLIMLGASIVAALVVQRETVVRHVPAAAALFKIAGLTVNLNGLEFSDIRSTILHEGDARFLIVEGSVNSVRNETLPVPLIEIRLRDDGGKILYTWTAEPPRSSLKSREALHFRTRLATPPDAGRDVEVRFTDKVQSAAAKR